MYDHVRCVALRTVKYDDRHSIVTAWSAERGRIALLTPAGHSREACRRRALMMPLGLFEGEVDIRPGRELLNIRDIRPLAVLPSIATSPAKSVVAIFLAEVLEKVLRDTPPDSLLFDFIAAAVERLDSLGARGTANFPLVFMCRLGSLLGIEPDSSEWFSGSIFDMTGGLYRHSAPTSGRWLDADAARITAMLQRLDFDTGARLYLPRQLRQNILEGILEYYSIHLAPLDSLKSLHVVRDLL